jgi:hypothetical protein
MTARTTSPVVALDALATSRNREHYWTQRDAAGFLSVSPRYLRASSCPKVLLPGTGKAGRPLVRYEREAVRAWAASHRSDRRKV